MINPLRGIAIVLLTIVMPLSFLFSCFREKKELVEVVFNPQTSYTMIEANIESFISDSGITRYKIKTDTMLRFDKASEPYWFFPSGIYLEQFDTLFNIEASAKSDTAYYFQRRKLWELDGNVDISNLDGIRFQTEQFFWSEQDVELPFYTDSFVLVTKPDIIQKGFGFRANKDLSYYEFNNASGEYAVEMRQHAADADSIPLTIEEN